MLTPGEGMLVGSFARAMFLVHSECAASRYAALLQETHLTQLLRLDKAPLSLQIHKFKAFQGECWPSECHPTTSLQRHLGRHCVLELSQCC